ALSRVFDRLATAHVQHYFLEPRDLHGILVAELLGHLLAHHLFVVRLHARLVVLGPGRAGHLLGLARLVPWRTLAVLGRALALPRRALGAFGGLVGPLALGGL